MKTVITSLHKHIFLLSKVQPNKLALITCDERGETISYISYKELHQRIEEMAQYLQAIGLVSNDRVALALPNCAEFLIVSWAAWSIGVITVPLDIKRDTDELADYKQKQGNTKMVLTEKDIRVLHHKQTNRTIMWKKGLSHEALVLFTSGTTAYPKGARLTLANLVTNAQGIVEWLHVMNKDRFSVQLPLHHINSTTFCLATLLAGGSIVIPPHYSNSRFFEQLAKTKATYTSIVQSILFDQLRHTDAYTAARKNLKLNRIQIGSAPVVAQTVQEFIKEFNIPLYQGYGQTETALRVTGVPMDVPKSLYEELIKENSIGSAMSWAHVEIADDTGNILGENEEGELIVKGPAVMKGYIGGELAFRDGYFLTGDIGLYKNLDGRRFFFLKGRKKEIIIKGGINISPIAVENYLKKIYSDIDQAYCFGIADDRYGEEIAAIVCFKEGTEESSALRCLKFALVCGTPLISAYETPKYLLSFSASDLPSTSTGKVQRTILKERIKREQFESLYELFKTRSHKFFVITPQSSYIQASHTLYNHCWQPLIMDTTSYKKYLSEYVTLAAIDEHGQIAGQISFSYKENRLTCVSICSTTFKPKPVPDVQVIPDIKFVREYLLQGHDPVMNFHKKLGAELVKVIPNGRPDDKSALGYTMLLQYPPEVVDVPSDAPVSNQLIAVVRMLAAGIGGGVYAVSRPGGLAAYMVRSAPKH